MRMRHAAYALGLALCTVVGTGVSPAHASGPAPAVVGHVDHATAVPMSHLRVQPTFSPITVPSNCSGNHPVKSPDGGATVCFKSDGEHLGICDTAADGHHPVAFFFLGEDFSVLYRDDWTGGFGTCGDDNMDLSEGTSIIYQACNYEGDVELSCSDFIEEFA